MHCIYCVTCRYNVCPSHNSLQPEHTHIQDLLVCFYYVTTMLSISIFLGLISFTTKISVQEVFCVQVTANEVFCLQMTQIATFTRAGTIFNTLNRCASEILQKLQPLLPFVLPSLADPYCKI